MRWYRYAGIPRDVAVVQVRGENFCYDPEAGTYRSTVEHPELKEYLVEEEEDTKGKLRTTEKRRRRK